MMILAVRTFGIDQKNFNALEFYEMKKRGRSASHSFRQRRDGPSIRIGATIPFGPINCPRARCP